MTLDPLAQNALNQRAFAAGLLPPDVSPQIVTTLPTEPPGGGVRIVRDDRDQMTTPAPGVVTHVGNGGGTIIREDSRHDTRRPRPDLDVATTPEAQTAAAIEEGYDPDGYDPGARR